MGRMGSTQNYHAYSCFAGEFSHCPLITEKVYRPFGHLHPAMSANYAGGPGPNRIALTDGTKYNYLFKELKATCGADAASI